MSLLSTIVMMSVLIGSCDFNKDSNELVNISFSNDEQLELEEGELFNLPINISDFKISEIKRKYPSPSWADHGSPSLGLEVSLNQAAADDEGDDVGAYITRGIGGRRVCFMGGSGNPRVPVKEGDSKSTFENIYVQRNPKESLCSSGCVLVVRLYLYNGCGGGGVCDNHVVSTIKRPITINATSHALEISKVSDTDVKITATKDGKPLANTEMKIHAEQLTYALQFSPSLSCYATDVYDNNKPVTTDTNGTKTITLSPIDERKQDLQIDVCKAKFSITVDGRRFSELGVSACQ